MNTLNTAGKTSEGTEINGNRFCERLDVKHIIDQRKLLFLRRLVHIKNDVVQTCLASCVHSAEFYGLCCKYNVDINMCSIHFIRYAMADHFYNIVLNADT